MKMANMDSAFDFMLTNPKDARGVSTCKFNLHYHSSMDRAFFFHIL